MVRPDMSGLSQEILAIIGVGVALAALILTVSVDVRGEFQSVRAEIQAVRDELRDVRAEAHAERQAIRAEARADREAMRAAHETFQNHILRLTEQQGIRRKHLDGGHDTANAGE